MPSSTQICAALVSPASQPHMLYALPSGESRLNDAACHVCADNSPSKACNQLVLLGAKSLQLEARHEDVYLLQKRYEAQAKILSIDLGGRFPVTAGRAASRELAAAEARHCDRILDRLQERLDQYDERMNCYRDRWARDYAAKVGWANE